MHHDITSLWQDDEQGIISSEDDCLALIDGLFPVASGHLPFGRGDDCAELAGISDSLALSTDMFWQDSHFRTAYFTPEEAGAKALTAAVSDLAAAGARPLGFSLGLLLPHSMPRKALNRALAGMASAAERYGMLLTGGDIARGDKLGFSLCVWGDKPLPGGAFFRRRAALPGDLVFLVGKTGLARVGLWALETYGRKALEDWPLACKAHLAPKALVEEGLRLRGIALEHDPQKAGGERRFSLMDVSDGLARDLPRLLGELGADLDFSQDIIADEIRDAAEKMSEPADNLFLLGGEDYALVGTCPPEAWPAIAEKVQGASLLGRVSAKKGIRYQGRDFTRTGFDHFSASGATVPAPSAGASPICSATGIQEKRMPEYAQEALDRLRSFGREAHRSGLMAGFNGNISCRLYDKKSGREGFLITRSGAAKGRLEAVDFVFLSLPDGEILPGLFPEAPTGPSSESPLHIAVYKARPESRFILHTHPPKLLALSLRVNPADRLRLPLPEAERYRNELAHVPFYPPGGSDLANAVGKAAGYREAIWMERHGLVAHGRDTTAILALCEELEQLAGVQLAAVTR